MLFKYYCYTTWNNFIKNLANFFLLAKRGGGKELKMQTFVEKMSIHKSLVIKETVKKIVKDKTPILKNSANVTNSVCLIGHSQFHRWNIDELLGLKVRNCGINGISMVEYREQILEKNLLKCNSKYYIILGGTNDIVYNRTSEEISKELKILTDYIKKNDSNANIFYIATLNVNNRKDRDNKVINELNSYVKKNFPKDVKYISADEMNDANGNLKEIFTPDGLHLSEAGYEKLKEILEENICKN